MMQHCMKLDPEPFAQIKSGEKTIELRLFDEKRRAVAPGDSIVFTENAIGEKLTVTVKKLHRFADFEALYKAIPLINCGYTEETAANADPSDMLHYYSAEEQKKYGVVGIEIAVTE